MSNDLQINDLTRELAAAYKVSPDELVKTTKAICFPGGAASNEQLFVFLTVARQHDLNPFLRELYAFVSGGKLQVIVGFDGWVKLVNRNPNFAGFQFEDRLDDKGNLVSVTCRMWRKDWGAHHGETTEYLAECVGTTEPWKKWPHRMLRTKAYIQCARLTFGFAGVIDPDEGERIEHPESWSNQKTPAAARVVEAEVVKEEPAPPAAVENAAVAQGTEQAASISTVAGSIPASGAATAPEATPPKRGRPPKAAAPAPVNPPTAGGDPKVKLKELWAALPSARQTVMLGQAGVAKFDDLTDEQASKIVEKIEKRGR